MFNPQTCDRERTSLSLSWQFRESYSINNTARAYDLGNSCGNSPALSPMELVRSCCCCEFQRFPVLIVTCSGLPGSLPGAPFWNFYRSTFGCSSVAVLEMRSENLLSTMDEVQVPEQTGRSVELDMQQANIKLTRNRAAGHPPNLVSWPIVVSPWPTIKSRSNRPFDGVLRWLVDGLMSLSLGQEVERWAFMKASSVYASNCLTSLCHGSWETPVPSFPFDRNEGAPCLSWFIFSKRLVVGLPSPVKHPINWYIESFSFWCAC